MALLVTLYHHLFQPSISENDASQKAANDLTRFVPGMLSGIILFHTCCVYLIVSHVFQINCQLIDILMPL